MLEQSTFDERANLVRDELGFRLRIFRDDKTGQRTRRIGCQQASRLVEEITQRIRQFDQVAGRAVIVCQRDHFRAGMQDCKVEQEAWIRSKPGEDGLRRIASNGEVAVFG